MARIVIMRHAAEPRDLSHHAIGTLASLWRDAGHDVRMTYGLEGLPQADLGILHIDLSVVPPPYRELAGAYPRVINGAAVDIRKRRVSRHLLARDSDWEGPVLVKSDFNCGGWPEWRARANVIAMGMAMREIPEPREPVVYLSLADVPDEIWARRDLVVERFLAERQEELFAIRHWIFFGDRERCKRCLSRDPVIKGANIVAVEDSDVPDEIRAERRRLGLDFGKMDFVIRNGRPVLFDANKTPGPVPGSAKGGLPEFLAGGLDAFLAAPAIPE